MEEQQVHPEPLVIDPQSTLSPDEGEVVSKLQ
jgi:hypothetical protein